MSARGPEAMTTPEELRKRLEALNREPLPARSEGEALSQAEQLRRRLRKQSGAQDGAGSSPPSPPRTKQSPQPIVFQRDLPRRPPPAAQTPAVSGPPVALEQAVPDGAPAPDGSGVFIVQRRLLDAGDQWNVLCAGFAESVGRPGSGLWPQLRRIGIGDDLRLEDLLLFDLETTGLSSSPLFLIGAMTWDAGGLLVRQYFARDYSQERAALSLFLELAAGRKLLVSFNGKSFDAPFVRMRAAANGLPCRLDLAHLDLLHAARRIWKGSLPDCKLQTLERFVCRRYRDADIPGHLIPDAYHAYVRTGNAVQMVDVLEHNFLDLVTIADLIVRMPAAGGQGGR